MYPYRIFLSYFRDDRALADRVDSALTELGLVVERDVRNPGGRRFGDAIRNQISRAHVFVPLLTKGAAERPWVHQETGFAIGAGIQILPIAVSDTPQALIRDLQALVIRTSNGTWPTELQKQIEETVSEAWICETTGEATWETVEHPEQRASFIGRYAEEAHGWYAARPLHAAATAFQRDQRAIRQSSHLTSFNLPKEPSTHPIWNERDGAVHRSNFLHGMLSAERRILGQMATANGCALIIDPWVRFTDLTHDAWRLRLRALRDFLSGPECPELRVIDRPRSGWHEGPNDHANELIVGDWFVAESRAPTPNVGYRHTVFTRHAPTVLRRMRRFDDEFATLCQGQQVGPGGSRDRASQAVERAMDMVSPSSVAAAKG